MYSLYFHSNGSQSNGCTAYISIVTVPRVTGVQPMFQVFQQYPAVLESDDARKIIRSYNKVAKVLLEYEVIYHQAWLKQVPFNLSLPEFRMYGC